MPDAYAPNVPRSIVDYQTMIDTRAGQKDDSHEGPGGGVSWTLQEFRGPNRTPVIFGELGIERAARVVMRYPAAVRSPGQWAAQLADSGFLPRIPEEDETWDALLNADTVAGWRRCMAAIVRNMRVPVTEDPDSNGPGGIVERAGYALMSTLATAPDQIAAGVRRDGPPSAADESGKTGGGNQLAAG